MNVAGLKPASFREDGFTVLEVMAALLIIAVGFFALISSTGSSARVLIQGKEKQTATDEANARLEDAHNVPYTQLALSSHPSHSGDPANPDYDVDQAGTGYDSSHGQAYETLVVDTTNGEVPHITTLVVGTVSLTDYEYVTWVDDPSITGTQDYKRVTVAVVYSSADSPGRVHVVQTSALLTAGSVTVGGAGAGPTQGSASPTPAPSPVPSPSPSGACVGDNEGPTGSFSILSGTGAQQGFTASTNATVSLAPSDPCTPITVALSNDNVTYGSAFTYDPTSPTVGWVLVSGDGTKNVWARYTDGDGNSATMGPASIVLDQTLPTAPGTLTRTATCSGSNRTVSLSWGASTDTNLLGYRIHKAVNSGAYSLLGSTSTTSWSDTDSKALTSVSYEVTAYDKAGNEGPATNVISLSKNQCS